MTDESEAAAGLSAQIVAAYVTHNSIPRSELAKLIETTHSAIGNLAKPPETQSEPLRNPAVPISKSVNSSYIVCLEDGRRFKTLRRHLRVKYGLTPDQYRARWGLPHDYPMVAPDYAEARSISAKRSGLGGANSASLKYGQRRSSSGR
ncbi:MucR family transcriptional regulator [Bosea caraganae]|uniref:MucR family transcriptional regulator n=1 Tax=Bosea caraganae TaxID=2763117 RepID=A0A370L9H2_9HYPH|nr:MucR family transcriptional regulator [Bosea caraganae]RDJ21991.1 MucR family transcriptional regulator [Bosea caraganae]RDJ27975.1 MucR family transcriptional regulator [Bosea caraganae]